VHTTILVTEMNFVMLSLLDIIHLHTIVSLRCKKETTLIIIVH